MNINKDIINNNVAAKNQVKLNQNFLGDINNKDAFKVMYIGNSITLHERKDEIGWPFNHGMAASKPENDYVHLINERLSTLYKKPVAALVYNAADFEREFDNPLMSEKLLKQANDFKPNLIVFRLGENMYKEGLNFIDAKNALKNLLINLKKLTNEIIITSLFWYCEPLDKIIKELSDELNLKYVYIADLGEKDENKAIGKFNHPGIQGHPGDLGMRRIAERLYTTINK